ncbi:hypothetical protein ACJX0J_011653, partial [Zea mays]
MCCELTELHKDNIYEIERHAVMVRVLDWMLSKGRNEVDEDEDDDDASSFKSEKLNCTFKRLFMEKSKTRHNSIKKLSILIFQSMPKWDSRFLMIGGKHAQIHKTIPVTRMESRGFRFFFAPALKFMVFFFIKTAGFQALNL